MDLEVVGSSPTSHPLLKEGQMLNKVSPFFVFIDPAELPLASLSYWQAQYLAVYLQSKGMKMGICHDADRRKESCK